MKKLLCKIAFLFLLFNGIGLVKPAQAQIYDVPCPAGTSVTNSPIGQTFNPTNNHFKAWLCVDALGNITSPVFSSGGSVGPYLDCSQQLGADMGAKINACISALPASGGIADLTKFTSPQTISTAVVINKPALVQSCGISITQTANISLTVANAAWHGCPNQSTIITKGASVDQFTITGSPVSVDYLTLAGASGSFTGNGIVISANKVFVINNTIGNEASDGIQVTAGVLYPTIANNDLGGFIGHGIHTIGGGGFQGTIYNNTIIDSAVATGSNVELNSGGLSVSYNRITNSHGFLAINNVSSTTNSGWYTYNFLQSSGPIISVGTFDFIDHNIMFSTGTGVAVTGGAAVTNNEINGPTANDSIDVTANGAVISNNNIIVNWGTNICTINLNSANGMQNVVVSNNFISTTSGSGGNAGICLTTVATKLMQGNDIINNTVVSNTGGGANSAAIFFNNAAGVTSPNAALNNFTSNTCRGPNICTLRTDAQNNKNYYNNNAGAFVTSAYSGGSTNDVVIDNLNPITFAILPTMGNGSQIYCSDCTQAKPTAAAGGGAFVVREAGQNNGL